MAKKKKAEKKKVEKNRINIDLDQETFMLLTRMVTVTGLKVKPQIEDYVHRCVELAKIEFPIILKPIPKRKLNLDNFKFPVANNEQPKEQPQVEEKK